MMNVVSLYGVTNHQIDCCMAYVSLFYSCPCLHELKNMNLMSTEERNTNQV